MLCCLLKNWGKSCLGNFTRRLSVNLSVTWLLHTALMNSEGSSWPWAEGRLLGIDLEILEMGIRSKQENLDGNLL